MSKERLERVFNLAYDCLRQKINGGSIIVENEASLQLQFAAILKAVGELMESHRDEFFSIELEKPIILKDSKFGKSGSCRAKIDIFYSYQNTVTKEMDSCAIEMKFFRKKNHREPNNRYDVFADIKNLESYGEIANQCFMLVATDHTHYVDQAAYSKDTQDFNFTNGTCYAAGTASVYRTLKPYGDPITLSGSYEFKWDTVVDGVHFMRLAVTPKIDREIEEVEA